MNHLTADQPLLERLEGIMEPVEIRDADGRVLGDFHPGTGTGGRGSLPEGRGTIDPAELDRIEREGGPVYTHRAGVGVHPLDGEARMIYTVGWARSARNVLTNLWINARGSTGRFRRVQCHRPEVADRRPPAGRPPTRAADATCASHRWWWCSPSIRATVRRRCCKWAHRLTAVDGRGRMTR